VNDRPDELEPRLLRRAVDTYSQHPELLGYWLDLFRHGEGLDPVQLARYLRCSAQTLDHLAICGKPREEHYFDDVQSLARRFGADPDQLADLLQHARRYAAIRGAAPAPAESAAIFGTVFAAASDREEAPPPEEETPDGR
jgi:hypothetical protein